MENRTIPQWGQTAGLTTLDLLSQVEVAFSEAVELAIGLMERDPQEIMDGLVDIDWMVNITESLSLDPMVGMYVGQFNLRPHLEQLIEKVQIHYPGLVEMYFEDFKQAVLESNFSKFCTTEEDAQASVAKYLEIGVTTFYVFVDGLYVIRSSADQTGTDGVVYGYNKILKGVDYVKPKKVVDYVLPAVA